MAVSLSAFVPRKRRPPASAFVSPNIISGHHLLQSLLLLSQETSMLRPLKTLLKINSSSILRKTKLLTVLFEELARNANTKYPSSAILCFEEVYIVLQRIKALVEDCVNGSRMWLLMQHDVISCSYHELTVELSNLMDVFPVNELNLSEDAEELVCLIRKQCSQHEAFVDAADDNLREQVLKLLDMIKREIVPDHLLLAEIFNNLQLYDSASFSNEIESLEDEVQNQTEDKFKADIVALIGLVRYAKCVLCGASTPRNNNSRRRKSAADLTFPVDFRCPISLDLMRDPVVVSTGQTYDRASIILWLESGHKTCPKTGQTLSHTELIPNNALKSLISMWCREQKISFELPECNEKFKGVITNKTALEATRMTVLYLINKLSVSQSAETANRLVHELRMLSKTDSDNRACITEAGGLHLLVKFLGSDYPNLQVNAVTTILNLSILNANKTRIMETEGVLKGVIEVLRSGATWESRGNAAATIFSLTSVHAYRKKLGKKTRVVKGLMELAKAGPPSSKRDALVAILNLSADRETVGKLVEGGVVEMAAGLMDGLPEEAVTILEMVVKKGGLAAVAAAYNVIGKLANVLRQGTDRAQEGAAATLVNICRKGGSDVVAELAKIKGIERVIWELMGMGTSRCRRKAGTLLMILRRWAAGLDGSVTAAYAISTNTNTNTNTNNITTTRIMLPA